MAAGSAKITITLPGYLDAFLVIISARIHSIPSAMVAGKRHTA
jgi:hypothetical protein